MCISDYTDWNGIQKHYISRIPTGTSKISLINKCPCQKLVPQIHPKKKKNLYMIVKNRKINLTFGVFGVIPSYLVRIEHIWRENNEKIFLMKKCFFDRKFKILIFFHIEIYQNTWKMMNFQHFPLLELVNPLTIDQNQCKWWIFVRRKIHKLLTYMSDPTHVCLGWW